VPAFRKVLAGYHNFKETTFAKNPELFKLLATKQSPKAMMIACSDSRVDPAIITNADPGDLFIVRNVANIVPPCAEAKTGHHGTSAALEFAVHSLQVEYIVVMGHAGCGGIRALMNSDPDVGPGREFIHPWIQIAHPAFNRTTRLHWDKTFEQQVRYCEQENVKVSLDNLMSFPWIRDRVQSGTLKLEGLYFDIADGAMYRYDTRSDKFALIDEEQIAAATAAASTG
jgi:carbonic anhydrase